MAVVCATVFLLNAFSSSFAAQPYGNRGKDQDDLARLKCYR
jgi:hypothetical protein